MYIAAVAAIYMAVRIVAAVGYNSYTYSILAWKRRVDCYAI